MKFASILVVFAAMVVLANGVFEPERGTKFAYVAVGIAVCMLLSAIFVILYKILEELEAKRQKK